MKPDSPETAERISRWNERLPQSLTMLYLRTEHERAGRFEAFLERFSILAPKVRIVTDNGEAGELPAFLLGETLRFHTVPEGGELEPFLDILSILAQPDPQGPEALRSRLEALQWPAELKLYVSPQCPFCPQALRTIAPLAFANPLIHVSVIDGLLFPESAQNDGIRSVPTLILDNGFRWSGTVPGDDLFEALLHRDPNRLSTQALKNFIKEGNASRLAEMMRTQGMIFPAFLELLWHPDWPVRLGAMVALEELSDEAPEIARQIEPVLWEQMAGTEEPIQGDLIYSLGLAGSQESIPKLEEFLAQQTREELRDVAEEALERLRGSASFTSGR